MISNLTINFYTESVPGGPNVPPSPLNVTIPEITLSSSYPIQAQDLTREVASLRQACLDQDNPEVTLTDWILLGAYVICIVASLILVTKVDVIPGLILFDVTSGAGVGYCMAKLLAPNYTEIANLVDENLMQYAKEHNIYLTPDNIEKAHKAMTE